ncbi:MAG: di-trans,poly-cis-decaprenylcistransferase [Verrucomicrobia bacterium]|nr:di-trans,poly-cis-decaprenylcistransferase [Verrucomicrobiota bacterium]MBS0646549.1 di-trans,poly-cis-decaprenylcistransferase [Verrucomicrobiota bacterium]
MNLSKESAHQQIFSRAELASLQHIPRHIAMIMDGNRRWSRQQKMKIMDPLAGHWEGTHNLFRITWAAIELGIEQLTLYGFSTENWSRSPAEVACLLTVMKKALEYYREPMIEQGVRLQIIGDYRAFPLPLQNILEETVHATRLGQRIGLNLALNYGGRDELKRAVQCIAQKVEEGGLRVQDITEETIGRYLDTASLPDPELLIRTSGELRISNFLLWQLAYTEFYITPVLWPDFSPHDLLTALQHYQQRIRRMGQ